MLRRTEGRPCRSRGAPALLSSGRKKPILSDEDPPGIMDKHRPKRPTSLDLFPRRQTQTGSQVGGWEGPAESSIISMGGSPVVLGLGSITTWLALATGCY